MQHETIERVITVDASPEVVYQVVSSPEHIAQWWSDQADFEPVAGSTGTLVWGEPGSDGHGLNTLTVVEAEPPRRFAFRWCYPAGEAAADGNSCLVTFDITPGVRGTTLRLVETGFSTQGRTPAEVREQYESHVEGWDIYVPRLEAHVLAQAAAR